MTTVVVLPNSPVSVSPANFEATGGQIATGASVAGNQATVSWDDLVNSTDQVRVVGLSGVTTGFAGVTSSDMTAPSFSVSGGTQTSGLGGDSFQVNFIGPRLIGSLVENAANWTISQDGESYSLSGSTITYDGAAGTASVVTGSGANLHAAFSVQASGLQSVAEVGVASTAVAGSASGDLVAPTLVSAEQDLGVDALGRVVNFTFSEAMDQLSSTHLANFIAGLPVFATSVVQPTAGVLRVSFTEPMVPGVDTVLLQHLRDSHGNAFAGATVGVAQGSSVPNSFAVDPELRSVPNALNDVVVVSFVQALDPEDATDPAHWSLDVASVPFDLSTASVTYDLQAKSLSFDLGADYVNGTAFDFGPASGNAPHDVDGDSFLGTFSGVVGGDVDVPSFLLATQNRVASADGTLIDAIFAEDLDETTAETLGNWSVSGGPLVTSAELQPNRRSVRLRFDALVLPGQMTLNVSGVLDLAGNPMTPLTGGALLSTDSVDPVAGNPVADAVEGASNDTVTVTFTDDMLETEVETLTSWVLEAPAGRGISLVGATVDYNDLSHVAVLTLAGSIDLPNREDFSLQLSGMRDLGGNTVDLTPITGTIVGDVVYPTVSHVWLDSVDDKVLHLRMSEPSKEFSDYLDPVLNPSALTTFQLRDHLGAVVAVPIAISVTGGLLQLNMLFDQSVVAGSHTLDVRGVTDLAGNQMLPQSGLTIGVEDLVAPELDPGSSVATAVSGEENDTLSVVFDRDMSPWGLTQSVHYDLAVGGAAVVLRDSMIEFDGLRTVSFTLDKVGAGNIQSGMSHTLTVSGLTSKWGVAMVGNSVDTIVGSGDSVVPALGVGKSRLNAADPGTSVLIEMSEAVRSDDGSDVLAIDISSVNPSSASSVGHRTTRAGFGSVSTGQTVNVTMRDLAGNMGVASQLITSADVAGPAVLSVAGTIVPGAGGDSISITYDRPVSAGTALSESLYAIDQAGDAVDLSNATPRYESSTNTVRFELPVGVELKAGVQVHVVVSAVTDFAGLNMVAADVLGSVTGDAAAPVLLSAFVNRRVNGLGAVVEATFSEDVNPLTAVVPLAWASDGGQFPLQVTVLDGRVFRVRFATPFLGGEQLSVTGVWDLAGNIAGTVAVSVVP